MLTKRRIIGIVIVALYVLIPSGVQADLVTFGVTGYTTTFDADASVGWAIPMGTPFYGSFTFDTTIYDGRPDDPTVGQYLNTITSSSFWLGSDPVVDAEHNGIADSRITVTDDDIDGFDTYWVREWSVAFKGYDVSVVISLQDYTASAFDNDTLPIVPPPLEAFWFKYWQIGADSPGYEFAIGGTVTSLTLMPEPTTALFLLGGTVVLLRRTAQIHSAGVQDLDAHPIRLRERVRIDGKTT